MRTAVCVAGALVPGPVAVAVSGPVAWRGNLWAVAHAAREVQGTVEWPGAGAWAGSAGEPPKALATAVSAQRIGLAEH
jgi:hypothetical protein